MIDFERTDMSNIISTKEAPVAIGPYSQAKWAGNTLFVSGQIPLEPFSMEMVYGVELATHQVMKNLEAILREAGLSFSNVVKTTIFLKDMEDFMEVNKVYSTYFPEESYPARETIEVVRLPKDAELEISMIAYKSL